MTEETANRYSQIIERIFLDHYKEGTQEVPFDRGDIERVAGDLYHSPQEPW